MDSVQIHACVNKKGSILGLRSFLCACPLSLYFFFAILMENIKKTNRHREPIICFPDTYRRAHPTPLVVSPSVMAKHRLLFLTLADPLCTCSPNRNPHTPQRSTYPYLYVFQYLEAPDSSFFLNFLSSKKTIFFFATEILFTTICQSPAACTRIKCTRWTYTYVKDTLISHVCLVYTCVCMCKNINVGCYTRIFTQ